MKKNINYTIKVRHWDEPDELLLEDMRRTARKLGKAALSFKQYDSEGLYSASTIERRFKSWNSGLIKAGIMLKREHIIADAELFENLKNVWDKLGRQPKYHEMKKPLSLHGISTYIRHFGTWHRALYAFQSYVKNGPLPSPSPAEEGHYQNMKEAAPFKNKHRPISKGMRFDVLKRDNYKCRICGRSPATDQTIILHVDHIDPVSKAGKTTIEELQTLCMDCNVGKGTKAMNSEQ